MTEQDFSVSSDSEEVNEMEFLSERIELMTHCLARDQNVTLTKCEDSFYGVDCGEEFFSLKEGQLSSILDFFAHVLGKDQILKSLNERRAVILTPDILDGL